jgi:hypothetical protein
MDVADYEDRGAARRTKRDRDRIRSKHIGDAGAVLFAVLVLMALLRALQVL